MIGMMIVMIMTIIMRNLTLAECLNDYGDDDLEDDEDTKEEKLCGFDFIAACFENCDRTELEFCPKLLRPSF